MKKFGVILAILLVFLCGFSLTACVGKPTISLNETEIELDLNGNKRFNLKATASDGKKVRFASLDESIATVSVNGVITAKSVGETEIEAYITGTDVAEYCLVYVIDSSSSGSSGGTTGGNTGGSSSGGSTGHTHNYTTTIVEGTCKEQGYTLYDCKTCSYSYKTNYTSKTNHKGTYDCSVCGGNAYTILKKYIMDNGTYSDSAYSLTYPKITSGKYEYYVRTDYSVSNDCIYLILYSYDEDYNLDYFQLRINPEYSGKNNWMESFIDYTALGNVTSSTFMLSTKTINCTYTDCSSSLKDTFISLATSNLKILLKLSEQLLAQSNLQLSVENFGFLLFPYSLG